MNKRTETRELAELARLWDVYMPWCWSDVERLICEVTLRTGRVVTLAMPLGAAVEIEERLQYGTRIKVIG